MKKDQSFRAANGHSEYANSPKNAASKCTANDGEKHLILIDKRTTYKNSSQTSLLERDELSVLHTARLVDATGSFNASIQ